MQMQQTSSFTAIFRGFIIDLFIFGRYGEKKGAGCVY